MFLYSGVWSMVIDFLLSYRGVWDRGRSWTAGSYYFVFFNQLLQSFSPHKSLRMRNVKVMHNIYPYR